MIGLICTISLRALFGQYESVDEVDDCIACRQSEMYVDAIVAHGSDGLSLSQYTNLLQRISEAQNVTNLSIRIVMKDGCFEPFPLSRLLKLTNLVELEISGTPEHKLKLADGNFPLCLRSLRLFNVELDSSSSISALKHLVALETNERSLLGGASSGLEHLWLSRISFDRTCDLSRYTNLTYLALKDVDCERVKGIGLMKNLDTLLLDGEFNVFSEELISLKKITELELSGPEWLWLCDENILSGFPLQVLRIKNVPIRGLRGLESCPLEHLSIENAPISRIDDLFRHSRLRTLKLKGTAVCHPDHRAVISHYPSLERIEYTNCEGGPEMVDFHAGQECK